MTFLLSIFKMANGPNCLGPGLAHAQKIWESEFCLLKYKVLRRLSHATFQDILWSLSKLASICPVETAFGQVIFFMPAIGKPFLKVVSCPGKL